MIKRFLSILFVLAGLAMSAQEAVSSGGPEMADTFREEGKIYVVISVIAMIFVCLAALLVYIERKLSRLEKKVNEKLKS